MSAFKPVTIYRPRKNVIAKFRSIDGANLPSQTVLFADLSLFREFARRTSATTSGKFDYDAAEYAVDNELPKPSYDSKQVRFHNELRSRLIKLRQDFIESKKIKPEVVSLDLSVETLDAACSGFFKYIQEEPQSPISLRAYRAAQNKALNLKISHDSGFIKRLGEFRFDEIEYDLGGTGFKVISALRNLVDRGEIKESTLYFDQGQIKRYFKYLKLKKFTTNIPLYPKVGQPETESIPYTDEELEKFETFARERYEAGDKNYLRGFYIARFTGARVHEIANLQIKHWHKDSAVHSHFKLPKAKGKKKSEKGASVGTLFASNDTLISFLEKDFEERDPEEYVLAKPNGLPWFVHHQGYTIKFNHALKKLGITGRQPWHSFRHAGAIELFEITGDIHIVKTFLRHKLSATTERYLNLSRVSHVVEKNQNFLGKKTVRTLRNQNPQLEGGRKLIEINPIKEVA